MSAEFIRRKILEGTAAAVLKFCGRAGVQPSKLLFATRYSPLAIRYSPVANRHSLFASRQSPFAAVFNSA
jgi:hypothetical protein